MGRFIKSFGYAFAGIAYTFKTQLNFKFHFVALLLACAAGWYLNLSVNEWAWIITASGLVFITELLNTAVEVLVDLVSPSYHQKTKIIKDISAAAVLFAALTALAIGLVIFIPKILYAA